MKRHRLVQLETVTEAKFRKEFQTLAPLLQKETALTEQLAKLDRQNAEVTRSAQDTKGYTALGTDVLWLGWSSATRRQLNTELARVRSQKLAALDQVRSAFGRTQAVKALLGDANRKKP